MKMKFLNLNKLIFLGMVSSLSLPLHAGDLDSPYAPTDPNSRMYTVEEIYDRFDGTLAPLPSASGSFKMPNNGPTVSTGHTLTEIYNRADLLMNTGSKSVLDCPPVWAPRFVDNGDGTVTDNTTCLMWLKDPLCLAKVKHQLVATPPNFVIINGMVDPIPTSTCTDYIADIYTDWRLPNIHELTGLFNRRYYMPPLSNAAGVSKATEGDPFVNLSGISSLPSSVTFIALDLDITDATKSWAIYALRGRSLVKPIANLYNVWPVRGPILPDP